MGMRDSVRKKLSGWLALVKRNQWPRDDGFIWNLENVPAAHRYFNPFLNAYGAVDLAGRLKASSLLQGDQPWSLPSSMEKIQAPEPALRQEMLFTLLRGIESAGNRRNNILETLQSLEREERPLHERDFELDLLNKAVAMKEDGRFSRALELVEQVLADHPSHPAARQLKIYLLEKKSRFVEASELKHAVNEESVREDV